ncbi:6713_t:CDS:2, partial [Cetraspora pellucida]
HVTVWSLAILRKGYTISSIWFLQAAAIEDDIGGICDKVTASISAVSPGTQPQTFG